MKLQIKFNFIDLDEALTIARATKDSADILEIGQLLLLRYGIKAVESFCKEFPDKKIYVASKLSERPEEAIEIFSGLNVHYISILAGTYNSLIQKACAAAAKKNIKVVLDLINACSPGQSAMNAETLGASAVLVHRESTNSESTEENGALENDWQQVRDNTKLPIFIQGKISPDNIQSIMSVRPYVIVVGDAITRSKDPAASAESIKTMLAAATLPGPLL